MVYNIPEPDDAPPLGDLGFFQHRTLPVLRKFQPSSLWDVSAPRLLLSTSSFRSVAKALAHQQRLAESPNTTQMEGVDRAYVDAISLVRKSIDAYSGEERTTLAFECLLLVILESLRGSKSEMIVHLHHGIRIVFESSKESLKSGNMKEIGRCLRQYGVSTMLLNPFLPPARQTQHVMWRTASLDDDTPGDSTTDDLRKVSNDVYRLILETLAIMYHVSLNEGHLGLVFCEEVARVRAKQARLEEIFHQRRQTCTGEDVQARALWDLTEARCLLAKAHLNYVWACDVEAFHAEIETFRAVIDLVDSALSRIEESESDISTLTFSVGLGAISALELVAWRCPDVNLRNEAVDLLERCPRQEGLWNADERSKLWRSMIANEGTNYTDHMWNYELPTEGIESVLTPGTPLKQQSQLQR
ncbi:hypothetical protein M409DRAFT_27897 [Zasmidium cellare ATCC 36951]|uniref:Uncharacterized protein n=1 Tax=Zasmidium cellare ATCC 36951 TaxID=1080233 RepID=A0A6A6C493_ZASCE|nr:uncharacterized protein M409DRAFT_27897 [Zasmidium cellare ATCC 36951]KAF2161841.1 hypothetical protein M409DRAFT_27897 [Zasmidium cellare ATCC 36951]